MSKSLCISLPSDQGLPPASSAFRNIMRLLRFFATSFFSGPEPEKTGLDRDKPGYSGIKSKIIFSPSHVISAHLKSSHIKNVIFF
jgi:hypothetical protein